MTRGSGKREGGTQRVGESEGKFEREERTRDKGEWKRKREGRKVNKREESGEGSK